MGGRVSIVIPTHNRPVSLAKAVRSALRQTHPDIEVIVVDDGSYPAVDARRDGIDDPRVRIIRNEVPQGSSAARNRGLSAATGRWVTFLDDDDALLPGMVTASLAAIEISPLPPPIAAISSLEVVDGMGNPQGIRLAPSLPRGQIFGLDPVPRGTSLFTKQSLVIHTDLLRSVGGFDEALWSRTHTELFLRLSEICSFQGVDVPGYRLVAHDGERISDDPETRMRSFRQILRKHWRLLWRKPKGFAELVTRHANTCRSLGLKAEAWRWGLLIRVLKWRSKTRNGPLGHQRAVSWGEREE